MIYYVRFLWWAGLNSSFRYFTDKAEVLLFVSADHTFKKSIKQLMQLNNCSSYITKVFYFVKTGLNGNHLLHPTNTVFVGI